MLLKPEKIFLIDGLGALLTAVCIGLIMTNFQSFFGMPLDFLYLLAGIACIFAVYSFSCHFLLKKRKKGFLQAIMIANLAYCCLTLVLIFHFFELLTYPGIAYFLLEILIILVLVYREWIISAKL